LSMMRAAPSCPWSVELSRQSSIEKRNVAVLYEQLAEKAEERNRRFLQGTGSRHGGRHT